MTKEQIKEIRKDPFGVVVETTRDIKFGDKINFFLTSKWIFETFWDKFVLTIFFAWAMYSFVKYVLIPLF
jgi:hypothetical protein